MPPERERERSHLPSPPPQPHHLLPFISSSPSYKSLSLHSLRLDPLPLIRVIAEADLVTDTDESPASIPASPTSKPKTSKTALLLKRDREYILCRHPELGDATVLCSYGVEFSNEASLFRKEFADVKRDFQGTVYWKSMVEREMNEICRTRFG